MHIDPKASFREMKMGFAVVGSVFVVLAILRIVSTLTNAINISTNAGNAYTQFLLANGLARTPPMGHVLTFYTNCY